MAFITSPRSVRIAALKIDPDLKAALQVLANDIANLLADGLSGTVVFDSGGLAIGTTTTKVKTATAVHASINGSYVTKAATDDAFTLAGTVPINNFGVWVFAVDAAGVMTATFGTPSAVSLAAVIFPVLPPTKAMIGYLMVSAGANIFTGGTTALTGGTVTTVYVNTPGVGVQAPQQFGPL